MLTERLRSGSEQNLKKEFSDDSDLPVETSKLVSLKIKTLFQPKRWKNPERFTNQRLSEDRKPNRAMLDLI